MRCWDREVHRDSQRSSRWNPGASWKPWLYERNFWIVEAKRQGAGLQEVMAVTGLSRRTIFHIWEQAPVARGGRDTAPTGCQGGARDHRAGQSGVLGFTVADGEG